MTLQWLKLVNFRSWADRRFAFSPKQTIVVGSNATGKTNILEAIWFLAWLRSFRAKKLNQLISWRQSQAQLQAGVKTQLGEQQLGISLSRQNSGLVKKTYLINGQLQPRRTFLKQFQAVIFRPEDIRLVAGSPGRRRQYFDQLLAGLDWQYARAWRRYQRALRQRNKLLEQWRWRKQAGPLDYWDQILATAGRLLQEKRRQLAEFIDSYWQLKAPAWLREFQITYQSQPISLEALRRRCQRDLERGHTGLGPQRDDFLFGHRQFPRQEGNLAYWASRGQQRLAILGLKLAMAAYLRRETGWQPLILLDDAFSELDADFRRKLQQMVWRGQLVWTATQEPSRPFWQRKIKTGGGI